jgi:hypothetical protein
MLPAILFFYSSHILSKNFKINIHKTVILTAVLYGCEIWSLRRMLRPKREEVAGGWRRLHNELHNVYNSPKIIRVDEDEVGGACSTHGTDEECIQYEGVSKSFWTGRLERELQMVQLSATGCSCITIL